MRKHLLANLFAALSFFSFIMIIGSVGGMETERMGIGEGLLWIGTWIVLCIIFGALGAAYWRMEEK